jgi:GNAT superfamily N-acetyltransferase
MSRCCSRLGGTRPIVEVDVPLIRRAVPGDREALATIARAAKAHWGYDEAFMRSVDAALVPDPEYLAEDPVFVAEDGEMMLGFYGFRLRVDTMFIEDMWVTPTVIGTGIGRALWRHALDTARANGYATFSIESDPYAEGFYLRQGAMRIGEIASSATGRMLPLLLYVVSPD